MNWLSPLASKGSGPLPPPLSSLQQLRQRQIDSLKASHPSLVEIQKDVEYMIPFTVGNSAASLSVLLPPQFPQEKPVVSVHPPVGHHLVDNTNGTVITSPLVTNFGMHSDLGKVTQSLLDEFWKSPPALRSNGHSGFPYSMYKPSGMAPYPIKKGNIRTHDSFNKSPQQSNKRTCFAPSDLCQRLPAPYPTHGFHYGSGTVWPSQAPVPVSALMPQPGMDTMHGPPRAAPAPYGLITNLPPSVPTVNSQAGLKAHLYKMPEIPEYFPELSELSVSQLKDMYEQEDVLLDFLVSLPQLKKVTSDREELFASNRDMAKENFQMEPLLERKRQGLHDKYQLLAQSKSAFETKMQRQHELSESCSLSALRARLQVAAHQAEEEAEGMAEIFLKGSTEIEDFLTSFMEKRTLCHSRKTKEEKLQQAINNTNGHVPTSH